MRKSPSILTALLLILVVGCGGSSPAPTNAEPAADNANQDMLATIEAFLLDPLSNDPQPIAAFMRESPDVMVVIDARYVPAEVLGDDASPLLLAGFIAANMQEQLQQGIKSDQPVAGVRGMLRVYEALKAQGTAEQDALESLAEHERANTLEAHLAEH